MVYTHSKWPDAIMMPKGNQRWGDYSGYEECFVVIGMYQELVADNVPPFLSKNVQEFLQQRY